MTHLLAVALVLQLHNVAGAPAPIVADAASEVTRLYAAIGLPPTWIAPGAAADASHIIQVIVLPYETGDLHRAPDAILGAAITAGERTRAAYVFYRRVRTEADRYGAS